jgi:hypothetical protein
MVKIRGTHGRGIHTAFARFRRFAVASLLVVGTSVVGIVVAPSTASAETGGCQSVAHGVHTSDSAPNRGWACWIDDGDKIRACDNAPNDGVHVHSDIWLDGGGFWVLIIGEDDNEDAGCDDQALPGNLQGTNHLRLRVCLQQDQNNFGCNEIDWMETE